MNVFDAYLQDKPSAFYKFDHTGTSFPNQMGDSRAMTSTTAVSRALNTPIVTGSAGPVLVGGNNTPKIPSDRLSPVSKNSPVSLECWVVPRLVGAPTVVDVGPVLATNLARNPSAEVDSTDWEQNSGTLSRSTAVSARGSACISITSGTAGERNCAYGFISAGAWRVPATPGQPMTLAVDLRHTDPIVREVRVDWRFHDATGQVLGSFADPASTMLGANTWHRQVVHTGVAPANAATVRIVPRAFAMAAGTIFYVDGLTAEVGTTSGDYFDGDTPDTNNYRYAWSGTPNSSTSIQFSPGPVGIFSHKSLDGISFDGEKINFSVRFQNEPPAVASWYVPDYLSRYHVVGTFNGTKVSLFIDGMIADEIDLTDAQKLDLIETPSDNYFYLGTSSTDESILIDAPAIYDYVVSPVAVARHFTAGTSFRDVVDNVMSFGGLAWTFDDFDRNIAISNDVELSSGAFDLTTYQNGVRPAIDETGVSESGSWTTSIPIAVTGITSLKGVKVSWEGDGYFDVQASFDLGITWSSPLENGQLIPGTVGFNTTDTTIDIRVIFDGGLEDDISVIRQLSYVAYPDTIINSDNSSRTITLNGTIATAPRVSELIESYANAGLRIAAGQTATLNPDTSDDPQNIQTVEVWFKLNQVSDGVIIDGLSISDGAFVVTGTGYFSGSSSIPTPVANQWIHAVIVSAAPFNTDVQIGGGAAMNVGMLAVYNSPLDEGQISRLYVSYFGSPNAMLNENSLIGVQESAQAYNLYDYDWQIVSGGR